MTQQAMQQAAAHEGKRSVPIAREHWNWPSFSDFRREVDRLFDSFSTKHPSWRLESFFEMGVPVVDVIEKDGTYEITAELPGMDADNVEVSVTDNMLTIKGEKKEEAERKDKDRKVSERYFGSFERSFTLPPGADGSKAEAKFAKGVLSLTMPRTPVQAAQSKKIAVKAA